MYSVNGNTYDESSEINAEIIKCFVHDEIRYEITDLVWYVLQRYDKYAPFSMMDVHGGTVPICPQCGGAAIRKISAEEVNVKYYDGAYICPLCGEEYCNESDAKMCCTLSQDDVILCDNCDSIFQSESDVDHEPDMHTRWFLVEEWVAKKLSALGETVILADGFNAFGCSEQYADNLCEYAAIKSLCIDLNILYGQEDCIAG